MASAASLFVLAFPFYGIQSVWSTEMAFGASCVWSTCASLLTSGSAPPYLLSLGIPRDLMSLVLLAAPLSGLVVQPIIGHRADYSKSRYGRRRPYMFVGSIVAGLSMLLLGYGKPAVELVFGADSKLASS
jgi:solute carrier family 45 protein 1/2/4